MSKVVALMSMSLRRYVADANDGSPKFFRSFFFLGDIRSPPQAGTIRHDVPGVSAPSADHLRT